MSYIYPKLHYSPASITAKPRRSWTASIQQSCSDWEPPLQATKPPRGREVKKAARTLVELQLHVPTKRISGTTQQGPAELMSAWVTETASGTWVIEKKKPKLLTGHTEKGLNFIHSLPKKLMMLFLEVNNQLWKLICFGTCCSPVPSVSSTRAFINHSEKRPQDPW